MPAHAAGDKRQRNQLITMAEFDSSVTAYFGGDTDGLAAAVTQSEQLVGQLEARFAEMGISMGDAPKKFAAESAKVFEDVLAGEKKVAEFRERVAFDRMSKEEKLATLQKQAMGIFERISAIEGNTVEKQALVLQYEQKKRDIYSLNQQIAEGITKEQSAAVEETKKHGGAMDSLSAAAKTVKKGFHEMGITLHGAGIGLVFAEILSLGKQAIADAQKQRDEYEKLGKPLDGATRSLAAFGDGLAAVKHGAEVTVGFIVSGWTQIGDTLGSVINRMRGISEADENNRRSAEQQANIQEARLKQLMLEERSLDRIREAKKAVIDQEKKAAFDVATAQEQLQLLEKKRAELAEQIKNTNRENASYYVRVRELSEATVELEKKRVEVIKAGAEQQLASIKTQSSLAETIEGKRAALIQQENVLLEEQSQLRKDSTDYLAVSAKLETLSVERQKLAREQMDAQILDLETRTELQKISLGVSKLDVDAQSLLVAKSEKQADLKLNQYEIGQLMIKQLRDGLNDAEMKRLAFLFEQQKTLENQLRKLDSAATTEMRRTDLARQWTMISNEQLGVLEIQIKDAIARSEAEGLVTDELRAQLNIVREIASARKGKDEPKKEGGQLGLHDLGNTSSDVLRAKMAQLERQMSAIEMEYRQKGYTRNAQQDNYYLQSQIDSIAAELKFRQNFTESFQRGGREGALNTYVKQGRDPFSFDTALANMQTWGKGLDVLQSDVNDIRNTLKNVFAKS